MALFVTLVIDGTIGMVLTFALIIALVVSPLLTLAVKRHLRVQPVLNGSAFSKGDKIYFGIKLFNNGFLPAPVISAELYRTPHFTADGADALCGSVTGRSSNTLTLALTAVHSGKAYIGIKSLTLTDYLGIFSFNLKIDGDAEKELTAAIYPDIPEVSVQTGLINTSSVFLSAEDDEEESDETSSVPTGLAGYDHREYSPGDPLKRINWKLSSKRDVLMVRLDEKIKGAGRTLLLDLPYCELTPVLLTVRDNVIEGMLAMLVSLIKEGREVSCLYRKQGLWMTAEIRSQGDIYALQEELSETEPDKAGGVLPDPARLSGVPIVFTSAMQGCSGSAELIARRFPDSMLISSYASSLPSFSANSWVLSEGFELHKM